MLLFERAVYLCFDYCGHKPHRLPKIETIKNGRLIFPVTDGLYALMKLPLARRCALCLLAEGFTQAEIAQILLVRPAKAARLCADPGIPHWREDVLAIAQTDEDAQRLSDRIYERFAERSVGVENAIHAVRQGFDRVAPFLALAVLAVVIAVCRVVTGVHYISDVLAGLAFGAVFAVVGWNAFVLAASAVGFYAIMLL